ncbi:MAG TPA: hypothetical protein VFQ60_01590 [Patescibacteria group bacterium]|nr:hypothetical protein [Patescibacteria group bacterium]
MARQTKKRQKGVPRMKCLVIPRVPGNPPSHDSSEEEKAKWVERATACYQEMERILDDLFFTAEGSKRFLGWFFERGSIEPARLEEGAFLLQLKDPAFVVAAEFYFFWDGQMNRYSGSGRPEAICDSWEQGLFEAICALSNRVDKDIRTTQIALRSLIQNRIVRKGEER